MSGSGVTERTRWDTRRKYHPDKHSLTFWTFTVTLTLSTEIPFFPLWLMMLYHQNKFDCKWISSLEEIVNCSDFDYISPCCDRNTEDSEPIFCMTHRLMMIHHHTKFGKKKKKEWLSGSGGTEQTRWDTQRKYHLDKHSLTFWTFAVTLSLNTVIPFSHRTLQLMMLYYQTKSGCKPTSSLEDTREIVIFDYISPPCDFLCMALWLIMLHNHTRFGDKMFCS